MSGLVIAQITVTDPEAYKEYVAQVKATVDAYGGEFIVRGGDFDVMEGEMGADRLVVLKFSTVDIAKGWYASDMYKPLLALRQGASTGNLVIVEGL